MKKHKDIVITPSTPHVELTLWMFFMAAGLFSLYQLTQANADKIWYFTSMTFLLILFQFTRVINNRFKKIRITKNEISIRFFLNPLTKHLTRTKIEGYKLSEVYHRQSTTFIIRLVTVDNKQIDIPKDGYENYEKVKK